MPRRFRSPNSEATLHQQVADYLRFRYTFAIFRSDYASGLKLTMPQAVQHKRLQSGRAWPDLAIYEPVGGFQGLFLELKREGVKVFKQDGTLRSDEHLKEQAEVLEQLRLRGYRAEFACGFKQAQAIIDDYFANNV